MADIESTMESGVERPPASSDATLAALLGGAMLSACGGGSSSPSPSPGPTPLPVPPPPPPAVDVPTAVQASRFLAQASMGATREQIARV